MDSPFLREAPPEGQPSAPCPPGWAAEPAGRWQGGHSEVVYDPRRHDVVFLRGTVEPGVLTGLEAAGYERRGVDAGSELWVRDRARRAQLLPVPRAAQRPSLPGLSVS